MDHRRGAWTVEHLKAAEQRVLARTPEGALMRRAAYGLAGQCLRLLRRDTGGVAGRHVVLLVGAGNNGGDALWAGYFLRRRGVGVSAALLAPDRAHPEGLAALRRAGGRFVTELPPADLAIDGIVGLSASGPLRPAAAELVARIDEAEVPIVAVDLPSGVDPDTGVVDGPAVRAAATVTFGACKPVHLLARKWCGEVHLVDIGLGPELGEPDLEVLSRSEIGANWPVPDSGSDKYNQGVTGVAAGSATYPGAAVLSTGAAVLATSGMVRFAGSAADAVRSGWPEVVTTGSVEDAGRVQAWVVGPGMGTGSSARGVLSQVLGAEVPVIADADAITLLAEHPDLFDSRQPDTPLVLTPHDREFERIAGAAPDPDRVGAVRDLAKRLRCVVLLKGNTTLIGDQDGRVLANPARTAWAATAGSGDVLSGVIGALLAAGLEPAMAAAMAARAHELAADLAAHGHGDGPGTPAPASRLLSALPMAIQRLRGAGGQ